MSAEEELDDDTLLERIAAKDRQAFRLLMERHGRMAMAMAQRVMENGSDADDVVQDAFLKVWTTASRWQPGRAAFSTWLYRVVLNLCIDRKRQRPLSSLEELDGNTVGEKNTAHKEIEATLNRQRHTAIMKAMEELPEKQKEALLLYYFADIAAPQAAHVLQTSTSAFEALLFRGKRALRKILKRNGIGNAGDIL